MPHFWQSELKMVT